MEQVVVLGAGLSGMITALHLLSEGIKPILLDKINLAQAEFCLDNRTTALTNRSILLLRKIGVFEKLQQYLTPVKEVYIVDNHSASELLQLSSDGLGGEIGYIIKNKDFKSVLAQVVLEEIDFNLANYVNLIAHEDHTTVVLDEKSEVHAQLAILCDADFNRAIKDQYFCYRVEKQYHQKSVVFDVCHEKPHSNAALEHFLPSGPLALLPLCSEHQSNVVWSMDDQSFGLFERLNNDERASMLEEYTGYFLGAMRVIEPHMPDIHASDDWVRHHSYNLIAKIAENYFYNRVVLVSDSAHILHPIAGQGFNQGMKDIESLCWNLHISGINTDALIAYEQQRKMNNLFMYHLTNSINGIFLNQSLVLSAIRKKGLKLLSTCSYGKRWFVQYVNSL
ncbi:2-octaprenyl-6-methoxyphenol hydroxylase [Rickettsiales endosymbiont of Paramecium tredecaurelia]|uniref:FAD-dependent monooxygenase n=1 Tax=Candidatus Sarmatiella mevalonica TaxID=2770581 RepID=UPI001921E348|nr:FAD-dependent monooxygenase [Candidatus Sarmatiella mevalonica]MBL3284441.1 2-octaprenyl-6-methoxyphenol hydroxylase [Candidatus Sarmatiella mevalonica]